MTAPSPKRTAPVATRQRILAAAERLFALNGFDRVSMPDIAAASAITPGAIYKHFASKDDLFFEVVRDTVEGAPPVQARVESIGDLARLIGGYAAPELKLVRRLAAEVHHASSQHPKVRKLLRAGLEVRIAELELAISLDEGAPPADRPMKAVALMVFIVGLMNLDSIAPKLIGDAAWRRTIERAVIALVRA